VVHLCHALWPEVLHLFHALWAQVVHLCHTLWSEVLYLHNTPLRCGVQEASQFESLFPELAADVALPLLCAPGGHHSSVLRMSSAGIERTLILRNKIL
jgi:hypothetical protein